jgi:hypothetical protein
MSFLPGCGSRNAMIQLTLPLQPGHGNAVELGVAYNKSG